MSADNRPNSTTRNKQSQHIASYELTSDATLRNFVEKIINKNACDTWFEANAEVIQKSNIFSVDQFAYYAFRICY